MADYDEMARRQQSQAADKLLDQIKTDEKTIRVDCEQIHYLCTEVARAILRQGEALQALCGHEQISFAFIKSVEAKLPWGGNLKGDERTRAIFETAKKRVALTCKIDGKISSWEAVNPEARKCILHQLDLLSICERSEIGDGDAPIPADSLTHFLKDLLSMKQKMQKCWRETPLESRTREQVRIFLEETEWIESERRRARQVLGLQK
jgi:hypothetical protein